MATEQKKQSVDLRAVNQQQTANIITQFVKMHERNVNRGDNRRGLFLWGLMGIGKTSIVRQVAKSLGYDFIEKSLVQDDQTDIKGVPVPVYGDNGNVKAHWAVPEWLPRDPEAKTIIILDDLPNAPPEVQASVYSLVLDGKVGETFVLPRGCIVMAAGNRKTDQGFTFTMPAPLRNRFMHLEMNCDPEIWLRWAASVDIHPAVQGFIASFPNQLHTYNPQAESPAFGSPRSWHLVSDICYTGLEEMADDEVIAMLCGAVGLATGMQFFDFLRTTYVLPKVADILDGTVTKMALKNIDGDVIDQSTPENKRLYRSLSIALNAALISTLRQDPHATTGKSPEFNAKLDTFIGFASENYMEELAIVAFRTVFGSSNEKMVFDITKAKNFQKACLKHAELLALI